MGLKNWLDRLMKGFDNQVEGHGHPADSARRPTPSPSPRNIVTQPDVENRARRDEGVRGSASGRGTTTPGPVRRRGPQPPARTPRHRLEADRRPRGNDHDDVADMGVDAATIASAAPQWIDVPTEQHDHRHHGHSVEHGQGDSGPAQSHTAHHHSHDSGGWGGGHHSHDSSGYDSGSSGGYDGGGASCGGGGTD